MRFGILRIELGRLGVGRERLLRIGAFFDPSQRLATRAPGLLGMRGRLQLCRGFQVLRRFSIFALPRQQHAEIQVRLEDVRLGRDRLAIGVDGLGEAVGRVVDIAQVEPRTIVVGLGGDRFLQQRFGSREIVVLHCGFGLIDFRRAGVVGTVSSTR